MARPPADNSVFTAIADPTRRAILMNLRDGSRTAGDLLATVDISQSAFSQHLAVLRRAGLVKASREGRFQIYAVNPSRLHEVAEWISHFNRFWTSRLDRLAKYLDRPKQKGRPS